jgi:tetratricopeptide (TPR) repeat protein
MARRILLPVFAALALFGAACGNESQPREDPGAVADATVAFWQQRVANDPSDFVALGGLGAAHAARARLSGDVADYAAASKSLETAIGLGPQSAGTLVQLGFVRAALHDFEAALELADESLELEPANPAAYALRGDALFALGRYEQAEAAYLEARRLAPGLETTARLALYAAYVGDTVEAARLWEIALASLDSASPADAAWALTEAARFDLAHGDADGASERAAAAFRYVPGYVPALAAQGDLRAARGDLAAAISAYQSVVTARPTVEYLVALGELHEVAAEPDAARRQYDVVAGIDQLYLAAGVDTDLAMARFHARHGDPARALELARRTYSARQTADAADALALALQANGRPAEALAYALQAVTISPANALFHLHAAAIAAEAGDETASAEHLARALAINPSLEARASELLG